MPRNLRSLLILVGSFAIFALVALWHSGTAQPPVAAVISPLQNGPGWWKGNLHTHSFWSDGDDFPEMIADWYQSRGYNFLTLSDHNILSDGEKWIDVDTGKTNRTAALKKYVDRFGESWVERRVVKVKVKDKDKEIEKEKAQVRLKPLREFRSVLERPGQFHLIPGEEITHQFAKKPVHMNAVNLRDAITPVNAPGVLETIEVNMRLVAEQKKKTGWQTLVFLNHPNFGWGVTAEEMLSPELGFFEVFNGHPDVKNYGDTIHAGTDRVWDILLALRLGRHKLPVIYGLATDDAHAYHEYGAKKANPGRGWIMVRAPYLSAEAIVGAMRTGDFYASSGVTLSDISATPKALSLKIAAQPDVTYKTYFYATDRGAPLDSTAILDKDGKPLPVTRGYSDEIGRVVAESTSLEPSYQLTGKEMYVRAKVVSSKAHPNPYQKGDVEMAWTQPLVVETK